MLSLAKLRRSKFAKTSILRLSGSRHELSQPIPRESGIYRFVMDRKVRYVGKTDNLFRRLSGYVSGLNRHLDGREVHRRIEEALKSRKKIKIYTLIVNEHRFFEKSGLPIDYLVGLEAGLIETLKPEWNLFNSAGRAKRATISYQIPESATRLGIERSRCCGRIGGGAGGGRMV
jgi:hypothetical protein